MKDPAAVSLGSRGGARRTATKSQAARTNGWKASPPDKMPSGDCFRLSLPSNPKHFLALQQLATRFECLENGRPSFRVLIERISNGDLVVHKNPGTGAAAPAEPQETAHVARPIGAAQERYWTDDPQ